ncbi:MAG: hypothetical protein Q9163_000715 [Psora crenata]
MSPSSPSPVPQSSGENLPASCYGEPGLQRRPDGAGQGDTMRIYSEHRGLRRIIRDFPPSWFSVTMGTGIVSIVLHNLPYNGQWLYWLSVVFFALNVLIFITFLTISIARMTVHETDISTMTALWLLPIVSTIVASASGSVVAGVLPNPQHALWTLTLPPSETIVSVFLPISSLGQGAFSILELGAVAMKTYPKTNTLIPNAGELLYVGGFLVALILWSFGLAWLFFAFASILRSPFPFNIGWWSFPFPLGAFAIATTTLGKEMPSKFFSVLGTKLQSVSQVLTILQRSPNPQYLNTLAELALNPSYTVLVYTTHEKVFVEISSRWLISTHTNGLAALAAFARTLPSAPHLVEHTVALLKQTRPGALEALTSQDVTSLKNLPNDHLNTLLLALCRLLMFDNARFATWVRPAKLQMLLNHHGRHIKYLSIRIICLYLYASDAGLESMVKISLGVEEVKGPWDDKIIDYLFFSLWERQRVEDLEQKAQHMRKGYEAWLGCCPTTVNARILRTEDFSSMTAKVGDVLLPSTGPAQTTRSSIVLTKTMVENMTKLGEGINSGQPLVVIGLPGVGKTRLIREVARALGKHNSMITLRLNEQTDAKLLVGLYTSTQTPGSFSWRPGVLTTALMEGKWVLLEDLDRASMEAISTLYPLIERGELLIPNSGEFIRAAPGFKLIATVRLNRSTQRQKANPWSDTIALRSWRQARLQMPADAELSEIVACLFPLVRSYLPRVMRVYIALVERHRAENAPARSTGTQDLLRWSRRIHSLLHAAGVTSDTEPIPEATYDEIFLEAVDCLAGYLPSGPKKAEIVYLIAQELHMPANRAKFALEGRRPAYLKSETSLRIGRAINHTTVERFSLRAAKSNGHSAFAMTNHTLRFLESVAVTVQHAEPCLLVGETGTGKTTIVQQLAKALGRDLTVFNLSPQSEAGDLLGGYKPVSLRSLAVPLEEEFDELLQSTIPSQQNQTFRDALAKAVARGQWSRVLTLCEEALRTIVPHLIGISPGGKELNVEPHQKRRRIQRQYRGLEDRWAKFAANVKTFRLYLPSGGKGFAFSFLEGNIVRAVRNGGWVLLDEINLASSDTLESLGDLFTSDQDNGPSLLLSESGDFGRIYAHKDFRIFAAMNPATDIGKRDLPPSIRSMFTETFVGAPDKDPADLVAIIKSYLGNYSHSDLHVATDVAKLYSEINKLGDMSKLADSANHKPHFSLRTLTRALVYATDIAPFYGLRRALFEGLSMSFLTSLNAEAKTLVQSLLDDHIWGLQESKKAMMNQTPRIPDDGRRYVRFRHYWIRQGNSAAEHQPPYIITPFVEQNLLSLVRATSTRRFPVLLQGPTSSGKTSMIEYLARISGNRMVRVNNHEHTDLQEYLGIYVSTSDGRLEYQDGVLVKALKEGHWLVLDELNLAPADILEALNRLLDDNRELMVPETQQVVRPHENFMLFATQNPPGMYGGRKTLSRAFQNRFLELHFDEIPDEELETILREKTQIAPSFCTRIVAVYKELSILRQTERIFEKRNSFATLRDLFRWALRDAKDREQLAIDGFMLLAERVRSESERRAVKKVIEKVMKVNIYEDQVYSSEALQRTIELSSERTQAVVWTKSMRRLYILIIQALRNKEPVLLVGETGSGKTTICQCVAEGLKTQLHIVNAHQNMETGDLIGAQRPSRNRAIAETLFVEELINALKVCSAYKEEYAKNKQALTEAYGDLIRRNCPALTAEVRARVDQSMAQATALFEWSDGSLVTAMKTGHQFLLDEISLADDSVLERLNSLLEPSRTLYLAEKGAGETTVTASDGFQFLATMNPGGDYGKRELSPALRNRFTEIWVPVPSDEDEVHEIAVAKILPMHKGMARPMVQFSAWFTTTYESSPHNLSLRDLISWINFLNDFDKKNSLFAVFHGACMVYLDRLGACPAAKAFISEANVRGERQLCISKLEEIFGSDFSSFYDKTPKLELDTSHVKIGSFQFPRLSTTESNPRYSLRAPTTLNNTMKILRALQARKPILLEGSPGVGKTTLVAALAERVGMPLTRVNLSDQTDLVDLFGSDVPIEGAEGGRFGWRDAPFLRAMQNGEWVLLDEMNLASQSVLEGLNPCFDHRGEVYVPELDQTFSRHADFVVFAAQNPHHQGGARKGLPASFIDRFTVVYADTFTLEDLQIICTEAFPESNREMTHKLVRCVRDISLALHHRPELSSHGGPWEVNLRDALRWLQLVESRTIYPFINRPENYQQLLFLQRFRNQEDRRIIAQTIQQHFPGDLQYHSYFTGKSSSHIELGIGLLPRVQKSHPMPSRTVRPRYMNLPIAESVMLCIEQNWPILLVGPSGSGKTNMIHHLASLARVEVVELCLNPDMDTTDLVGGFEQLDPTRQLASFATRLREYTHELMLQQLTSGIVVDAILLSLELRLRRSITAADILPIVRSLAQVQMSSQYPAFLAECETLVGRTTMDNRARFEWVDSILIKALKQGKWLILNSANLCNPSVLDRLNSLLEPNGFLAINEHRDADGGAQIVHPHPDFRVFMTMDPRHGELSRAMRNRAVELFMPAQTLRATCNVLDPAIESMVAPFARFQAFCWDQVKYSRLIYLLSICFDHLSFETVNLLDRWQTQVLKSMINMPQYLQDHFKTMTKSYHQICSSDRPTSNAIRYTYGLISSNAATLADVGALQTIHPFNNPVLLPLTAGNPWSTNLNKLGQSFELLLDIYTFGQELARISCAARNMPLSKMSRLERSFASFDRRSFRNDSTQPLADVLQKLVLLLQHVVDDVDTGDIENRQSLVSYAKNVLHYLYDLVSLAQSHEFDEGTFQVYQSLGTILVAKHKTQDGRKDLPAKLADELAINLDRLRTITQLYSGSRMDVLWKAFKPFTVHTLAQLDLRDEIEKLADGFDELKWIQGTSILELSNLRASLIAAYKTTNELQKPLQGFEDVREALESLQQNTLPTSALDGPYFVDQFDGLNQYEAISSKFLNALDSPLAILSGKQTRTSMSLGGPSKAYNLLKSLPYVMGTTGQQTELAIVRQALPLSILCQLGNVSEVSLKSMELLMAEMGILTKSIARLSTSLTKHPLECVMDDFRSLHGVISQMLRNSINAEDLRQIQHYLTRLPHRLNNSRPLEPGFLADPMREELARFEHLCNSIQYVTSSFREDWDSKVSPQPKAAMQMAHHIIQLFTGCLLLYVPDRAYDPALRPKVERDRHNKRRAELQNKIEALQQFEELNSGHSTSYRVKLAEQELQALGEWPALEPILRPRISELDQLQGEFNNILRTIILLPPEAQLLETAFNGDDVSKAELELRRRDLKTAISKLTQGYRAYEDIVDPLVSMLQGLDTGLALVLVAASKATMVDHVIEYISWNTPFMGCIRLDFSAMSITHLKRYSLINYDARFHFLKTVALVKNIEENLPPSGTQTICLIFETFYCEWKQQLHSDRQDKAAEESLYRYRAGEQDTDEIDEKDFLCLFPDYERPEINTDNEPKPVKLDPLKRTEQLAGLQRELFANHQEPTEKLESLILTAAQDIQHLWSHELNRTISPVSTTDMLSALILSLNKHNEKLQRTSNVDPSYSFYTDANVFEAERLVILVRQTQTRFLNVEKAWPEHATPVHVLRVCTELLAMRHTEPIAKLLTKTEQLHAFVHEWQLVSSREYSAAREYDQLTQLLVSWRRLELSTWARLLDLEDEKAKADADSWWFVAYETMVSAPLSALESREDIELYAQQLFSTLEEFIARTSVGQFSHRLVMIDTFQKHVTLLVEEHPSLGVVRSALFNFVRHYRRLEPGVQETLQRGRRSLEAEIKEILLLASWKDTNINALRDSAKRSHYKLFKVVRKYRALLCQGVVSMLEGPAAESLDAEVSAVNITDTSKVAKADACARIVCQQHIEGWSSKPARFARPDVTAKRMLEMSHYPSSAIDGEGYLKTYAEDLLRSIRALQAETSPSGTGESIEAQKHLKVRKRKLFSHTLRDLRQMGFSSNLGLDVLARQASTASALSKVSYLERLATYPDILSSEYEIQSLLNTMPQVRACLCYHHEDLSHGEIGRSVGYLESILSTILMQRVLLTSVTSNLANLEETKRRLANTWAPDAYQLQTISEGQPLTESIGKKARWLQAILDMGAIIIKGYDKLGGVDSSAVLDAIRYEELRFAKISEKLKTLPALPVSLTSSLHAQEHAEYDDAVNGLGNQVKAWTKGYPHLAFVFGQIEPWVTIHAEECSQQANGVSQISLQEFGVNLFQALDSILVAIQDMQSALMSLPTREDDQKWLLRLDMSLAQSTQKLHTDGIVRMLNKTLAQMCCLEGANDGGLNYAAALCAMAFPIVEQYHNIAKEGLKRYAGVHLSLCKLAAALSKSFVRIGKDGFCSPSESPRTKSGNAEKLEGGTGLGEGEGVEDISKDIQDDEDLSELAQQGQKDGADSSIEEQQDAVNMDHDELEGEVGDTSDGAEEDDSGTEPGENSIENEMGNVDELDPTAVDEMLWDGEGDETQNEKEGSKERSLSNKTDHAVQASAEQRDDAEKGANNDEEDISQQGADENEAVACGEPESMNPHIQESQNLDLPEGMDLDNVDASDSDTGSDADSLSRFPETEDLHGTQDEDIAPDEDDSASKNGGGGDFEDPGDPEDSQITDDEIAERKAENPVTNDSDYRQGDEGGNSMLQDSTNNAAADPDTVAPSESQGFGRDDEQQTQEDPKQQNAYGEQGNPFTPPENTAATAQGDRGQGSNHAEPSRTDNSHGIDKEQQPFKKLGDALKEWQRQQSQILDAVEHPQGAEQKAADIDMPDADLEHIPEDSSDAGRQALGAASNEQVQALNEQDLDSELQRDDHTFRPDETLEQRISHQDDFMHDVSDTDQSEQNNAYKAKPVSLVVSSTYQKSASIPPDTTPVESEEDIDNLYKDLSVTHLQADHSDHNQSDEASQRWADYESATRDLSLYLTEQLRLILAPTLATKMRGDFRTGKRLNIKRIIPYIASEYRRDKIWMRRTIPSKRNYQIMLAVDDSKSMSESGSEQLAFKALALVAKSLSMLEVGEICVVGFGNEVVVAHPFGKPFSTDAGASVLNNFGFQQSKTNVQRLVTQSITLFQEARRKSFNAHMDLWQLELIISDGVCEDHDTIRRLVRQAQDQRIMIIFVIVDALHQGNSILDMSQAIFEPDVSGEAKLKIKRYLDGFPFPYYLVVGDVSELPGVLAQALRQWFSEIVEAS